MGAMGCGSWPLTVSSHEDDDLAAIFGSNLACGGIAR